MLCGLSDLQFYEIQNSFNAVWIADFNKIQTGVQRGYRNLSSKSFGINYALV